MQLISLNLLSLLGYILAIILSLIIFYFYPSAFQESLKQGQLDNFEITAGMFMWIYDVLKWFLLTETVLLFLALIEVFLCKLNILSYTNIFSFLLNKYPKIYLLLFCIGILFSALPFAFFLLTIIIR